MFIIKVNEDDILKKNFWNVKVHVVEETPLYVVYAPVARGLGVLPKHLHCCTPK